MFNVKNHYRKHAAISFDASTVAPSAPLDPVPSGWYTVMITASEQVENSKKTGQILELEMTIALPEQFKGRKVFDRLNIINQSAQAQEIAFATLSAICHATGVIQLQDSSQLHNRPFQAKVRLNPAGPGADGKEYDANNSVTGYKGLDIGTAAPAAGQVVIPPATTAAAPATGFVPPVVASAVVVGAPVASPTAPVVTAPATPTPVVAAPSGLEAAKLDGWLVHPTSPGWMYKGQEVLTEADLAAKYPAAPNWTEAPAAAAPAAPTTASPVTTPVTATEASAPAAAAVPPWQKK